MEIRIEKHVCEQADDNAEGLFAGGIANSAIAGKCGNGGMSVKSAERFEGGEIRSLMSQGELLEARDKS